MDQELKTILGSILNELTKMNSRLDSMEQRVDAIEQRMDSSDARQNEIFVIVKAIEHSNQVGKAGLDQLDHRVSKTEGVITGFGEVIQKSAI